MLSYHQWVGENCDAVSTNARTGNQGASPPASPRVVLIDDDRAMAAMLSRFLNVEGFSVKHAETAGEGLFLACEPETTLVLLDVLLPDRNGFSLLRELRTRSQVPVIMLTMQGAIGDRVEGLEIGADDYVPKPFSPIEVLARIRSLLRRNQHAPLEQSPLTVDDISLAPVSRTVLKGGIVVACTAAEFDVLQALLVCAGTIVAKNELTRSALRRASYPGDRGVDNLVHSLRKKLGLRSDGEDRFKAVRNIGYVYLRTTPATPFRDLE